MQHAYYWMNVDIFNLLQHQVLRLLPAAAVKRRQRAKKPENAELLRNKKSRGVISL